MTDEQLDALVYPVQRQPHDSYISFKKKIPTLLGQLKKKHNTMLNVWEDYRKETPDGYSYSRFCHHLQKIQASDGEISMHLEHEPGDRLFVDFAGDKLSVKNAATNEEWLVDVFVGVLPASLYTWVEATVDEKTASWITCCEHAQHFFGGVPRAITPDCARAVVKMPDRYESEINPQYYRFARHYATVIMPARPGHPKDKALVENTIRLVYQRIYTRLEGRSFFTIDEINAAIHPLLQMHNDRVMRAWNCSRRELFESREKALLRPLPEKCFEHFDFQPPRSVAWNCHVYFKPDRHYYSVPIRFKSKKCSIFSTNSAIEIYCGHERIAVHRRDRKLNGYTTNSDHIPPAHKAVLEWTPERISSWAKSIGANTGSVTDYLFTNAEHPFQAMRSAMGIISLSKKYDPVRLEKACARAMMFGAYSYKKIESILLRNADSSSDEQLAFPELPHHHNLRF